MNNELEARAVERIANGLSACADAMGINLTTPHGTHEENAEQFAIAAYQRVMAENGTTDSVRMDRAKYFNDTLRAQVYDLNGGLSKAMDKMFSDPQFLREYDNAFSKPTEQPVKLSDKERFEKWAEDNGWVLIYAKDKPGHTYWMTGLEHCWRAFQLGIETSAPEREAVSLTDDEKAEAVEIMLARSAHVMHWGVAMKLALDALLEQFEIRRLG